MTVLTLSPHLAMFQVPRVRSRKWGLCLVALRHFARSAVGPQAPTCSYCSTLDHYQWVWLEHCNLFMMSFQLSKLCALLFAIDTMPCSIYVVR